MRIKTNFKGHLIQVQPNLNYANMSDFQKSPNFDAANSKCFTVNGT